MTHIWINQVMRNHGVKQFPFYRNVVVRKDF